MKRLLIAVACGVALPWPASAAEFNVDRIQTPGEGRIEECTSYFVYASCKSKTARIPSVVRYGDMIEIMAVGETTTRKFPVKRLRARDDGLCWIFDDASPSLGHDTIYVKPCIVLQK